LGGNLAKLFDITLPAEEAPALVSDMSVAL
jgi:hypothetical protein